MKCALQRVFRRITPYNTLPILKQNLHFENPNPLLMSISLIKIELNEFITDYVFTKPERTHGTLTSNHNHFPIFKVCRVA